MFNRVRTLLKGMIEVPLLNGDMVSQMHDRVRYMCYCYVRFLVRMISELAIALRMLISE